MSDIKLLNGPFEIEDIKSFTGKTVEDLFIQLKLGKLAKAYLDGGLLDVAYKIQEKDYIVIECPTHDDDAAGRSGSQLAVSFIGAAIGGPVGLIFTLVGSILINRAFPPPEPSQFDDTPTPNYFSWNSQPTQRAGIPIPMIYGKIKVKSPNIISAYRDFSIGENYINLLLSFGLGPIQSVSLFDSNEDSLITLNNTPINQLNDVQVQATRGLLDQETLSGNGTTIIETDVSATLWDSNLQTINPHTETINISSPTILGISLTAPSGLYGVSNNTGGSIQGVGVIAAYYRKTHDGGGSPVVEGWRNFTPDRYEIGEDVIVIGAGSAEFITRWTAGRVVHTSGNISTYIDPLAAEIETFSNAVFYWEIYEDPAIQDTDITSHYEGEPYGDGILTWHWTKGTTRLVGYDATVRTAIDLDQYPNFFTNCVVIDDTLAISPQAKIYLSSGIIGSNKDSVAMSLTTARLLDAGTYQVRTSARAILSGNQTQYGNIIFNSYQKIALSGATYPRHVLISLRGLATDKINTRVALASVVEGKIINVYNGTTWALEYNDNPAWVAFDCLTQPVISGDGTIASYVIERYDGISPTKLDEDSFKVWADWCDTLVDDGVGGTEKRFTFNGVIDQASNAWDTAFKVASVTRAFLLRRGSKIIAKIDNATTASSMFTLGNINKASYSETFSALEERATELEADFLNSENFYSKDRMTLVDDSEIDGVSNRKTVVAFGLVKASEVLRFMDYQLKINKYVKRLIQFDTALDSITVEVGDVFKFQHDVPLWGNGGRIISATATEIVLDQEVIFEVATNYVLYIRNADDTLQELTPTNSPGTTDTLTFALVSPVPTQYALFAFGELSSSIREFKVDVLQRLSTQYARIKASEYNPLIYADDSSYVPEFTSITQAELPAYMKITEASGEGRAYYDVDKVVNYELGISWVKPVTKTYNKVRIEYTYTQDRSVAPDAAWINAGDFNGDNITIPVITFGFYTVRFRPISNTGEIISESEATLGFIEIPEIPQDTTVPYMDNGVSNLRIE